MTKNVYICGASDCSSDPNFLGQSWHEKMEKKLPSNYKVHNLAVPGASNFLIRLQIDRALELGAHAILINFTSSVRTEILLNQNKDQRPLLDRFYKYQGDVDSATLLSISRVQARNDLFLSAEQQQLLERYQLEFFDLDCAVQKNYYLIHGALTELTDQSTSKFCFSLGGFEHPDYMSHPRTVYHDRFLKFKNWQSQKNLWDYLPDHRVTQHNIIRTKSNGPIFHIIDPTTTNQIAEYFYNWLMSN
jgi:hypothetical protein